MCSKEKDFISLCKKPRSSPFKDTWAATVTTHFCYPQERWGWVYAATSTLKITNRFSKTNLKFRMCKCADLRACNVKAIKCIKRK